MYNHTQIVISYTTTKGNKMGWFNKTKSLKTYIVAEQSKNGYVDSVPGVPNAYFLDINDTDASELRNKVGDAFKIIDSLDYIHIEQHEETYIPIFSSKLLAEIYRQCANEVKGYNSKVYEHKPDMIQTINLDKTEGDIELKTNTPSPIILYLGYGKSEDEKIIFSDDETLSLCGGIRFTDEETDKFLKENTLSDRIIDRMKEAYGSKHLKQVTKWDKTSDKSIELLAKEQLELMKENQLVTNDVNMIKTVFVMD
jgi:hypothetical protein